jgi:hypothetical protein
MSSDGVSGVKNSIKFYDLLPRKFICDSYERRGISLPAKLLTISQVALLLWVNGYD